MEERMRAPVLNITMPVFNRLEMTQRALSALHQCSRRVPFTVTVVDNGSDKELVDRLVKFKQAGMIDKLFLLESNIGIAGAANIGWEMTDAPYYMKLDNDVLIQDPAFFSKVFALWAHGKQLSTLGGVSGGGGERNSAVLDTPDGTLGICRNTLCGQAIFVPKAVSDILGCWSEDYGRFGEDADYGLRMHRIGFAQYSYDADGLFENLGDDLEETYLARGFDKSTERKLVVADRDGRYGLFMVNQCLYNLCIRTWRPVRRYKVLDISSDYRVQLGENEEFFEYKRLLDLCMTKINERVEALRLPNPDDIFSAEFIEELKGIMKSGGWSWDDFAAELNGGGKEAGTV